ncbi:hypothetical protein [Endozoicomonas sp.]|uniref:hypothetical protein n=1 Tax=Endozoicomonas sp. TaxID=1892382 RepID=UPI003AF76024
MEAVIEAVPMPQVADLHPAAGEGGEPNLRRMGPRDVFLAEPADPQLLMDAINPSLLKTIKERAVCSFDTLCLGIADACKWGAYAGVWGGMIATGMVSLMSLPSSLLGALLGGAVGFGESVVEGGVYYAEHRDFPRDQCPLLLGNIPIENLPVVGDFISFGWMKHLPYQGENVNNSVFTFVGSRVSSGATVGFGLGSVAALVNINPSSILAAAAFTALAAFSIAVVINVAGVMLNSLILTNFEMKENYREFNRLFNKPIGERIVENVKSVLLNIQPEGRDYWSSPKTVEAAATLLGIPRFRVSRDEWGVTKKDINNATLLRIRRAKELFPGDVDSFDRFRGLYVEAWRVLSCEIEFKQRKADKERRDRAIEDERQRAQDRSDRNLLGLPEDGVLQREMIDAGYAEAANLWENQFKFLKNSAQLDQAQRRLRERVP